MAVVPGALAANTIAPFIEGSLISESTLTFHAGTWWPGADLSGIIYVSTDNGSTWSYLQSIADTGTIQLHDADIGNSYKLDFTDAITGVTATSGGSGMVIGHVPLVTTEPDWATGDPTVNTASVGTPGYFDGGPPTTFEMQWQLDGVECAGETGNTFTPRGYDYGRQLGFKVRAANVNGWSNWAYSATKLVDVDTQTAICFIDIDNGSNTSGTANNPSNPVLTIDGATAALQAQTGALTYIYAFFNYPNAGTYDITNGIVELVPARRETVLSGSGPIDFNMTATSPHLAVRRMTDVDLRITHRQGSSSTLFIEGENEAIPYVDLSGVDGEPGSNGIGGGTNEQTKGNDGADGDPPTPGENGPDAIADGSSGTDGSDGTSSSNLSAIGNITFGFINANGGDGGAGGNGGPGGYAKAGDGGHGGNSTSENYQDGGNGGNGGNASANGAPGGKGGNAGNGGSIAMNGVGTATSYSVNGGLAGSGGSTGGGGNAYPGSGGGGGEGSPFGGTNGPSGNAGGATANAGSIYPFADNGNAGTAGSFSA
jgi:hypothetical protein